MNFKTKSILALATALVGTSAAWRKLQPLRLSPR
jgi:hypothetical protein